MDKFTLQELEMLIKGCTHYYHCHAGAGNTRRASEWVRLQRKLQDTARNYLRPITPKADPRDHPGYDDDCHI